MPLTATSNADYVTGRTWTTDAFHREPLTRIARRIAARCLVVEMEAAAFIAVARFRAVRLGQLLYAGDSVAGAEWDHRDWFNATETRPVCSTSPRPQHCASTPPDSRRQSRDRWCDSCTD